MNQLQLEIMSPIGPLFLVASEFGLSGVYWERQDLPLLSSDPNTPAATHLLQAAEQIQDYLSGERQNFDLTLAPIGTAFQQEVWNELRKIPFGQTISYKELASRVHRPNASRAVGTANGRNPLCLIIPCHRVIAADRGLGGYSGGLERKRWLLQHESSPRAQ